MPTPCQKIALSILGVGCFLAISAPLPFLFSPSEPQNIWMAIGLIFSDLALIQLFFLEDTPPLIFLSAPSYCGIISGLGAAIYQVILLNKGDWAHQYALIVLFIMAFIYSSLLIPFVVVRLDPNNEWYTNSFVKSLTQASLGFYFVAFSTAYLIQTITHFQATWLWIYINYGLILVFVTLFAGFAKIYRLSRDEPEQIYGKLVKCFVGLYYVVYIPAVAFSVIQGYKEYLAKVNFTNVSNQYFTFIITVLGSTCATGVAIVVAFPVVFVGSFIWRVIKKLFVRDNGNNALENDILNDMNDPAPNYESMRKSLLNVNFEEANGKSCSICWEEFKDSDTLTKVSGCNHTFHDTCLMKWYEKSDTCPMCRVKIKIKLNLENPHDQLSMDYNLHNLS